MFDPRIGRFLSQDPIGFEAGDANLYRYVGNGPTTKTDPSGLAGKEIGTKLKGITLFLEWWPEKLTGEIKVKSKTKGELAIIKYVVDPDTGRGACNVVARHAGKGLPGVANSKLKKLAPEIRVALETVVRRVSGRAGTWTVTHLAVRPGAKGASGIAAKGIGGAFLGAIGDVLLDANVCEAAEIPRPTYIDLTLEDLGLSEEELELLIQYAEDPDQFEVPIDLDDLATQPFPIRPLPSPSGTPRRNLER